jgi:prepilin-type N-terminal cleavage/methylation domain-containing protein/prepilin-type processing-associated H-X9-DG protein
VERRRGFTLIELLVVIAIIGILAAMLFPVFARARESARKIQCLANVKNIAIAFQMYLTDYDRMPPAEHREEVIDYFCDTRAIQANPYLPLPEILDEYIKNRDVWACPASRWHAGFAINPGLGSGGWFGYFLQYESNFWDSGAPCNYTYPPGWGGTVTDSARQGTTSDPGQGGFKQDIGTNLYLRDLSTSEINDVAKYVVASDIGAANYEFNHTDRISYVDTQLPSRAACRYPVADWENCSWTRECGAGDPRFQTDPQFRKTYAQARHLGGTNLGFADGHAKWFNAEALLFGGDDSSEYVQATHIVEGVPTCGFGPPNAAAQAFLDSLK